MFFRQVLDPDLGCASYVLGDAGRAVVVDPTIDVDRILAAVAQEDAAVVAVLETHTHADHVSGRALVAGRTGAEIRLPAGDPDAGAPIGPGDALTVGSLRIEAVAAPGHRPEHLAYLVTDTARCPHPCLLLSGDSLMVGDVARPDLAVDAADGARALHATLERLLALPDGVEVWPGHVGGSLCGGGALSPRTSTTIGYERAARPLPARAELVASLTASLPARPPTVEHVVALNRSAIPARRAAPPVLCPNALSAALDAGAVVVDARDAARFEAAHVPRSLSLPLEGRGLGTRAGWLLDPDTDLVVVGDARGEAGELARRLRAVGFDSVLGLVDGGAGALRAAGLELASSRAIPVADLPGWLGELTVLDVRDDAEWRAAHLPDAVHVPLPRLRGAALPPGPLAVACASGRRAAFAAAWLRRRGRDARRVAGGLADLPAFGLPLAAA